MDIVIDELIIEEDRPEHIAKHEVTVDEVQEVIEGDYVFIQGKFRRVILIGKTKMGRVLAVVVGARKKKNTYGLVTARPADRKERAFYYEFTVQQGEPKHGQRKA